jgi:hypothetical protein
MTVNKTLKNIYALYVFGGLGSYLFTKKLECVKKLKIRLKQSK